MIGSSRISPSSCFLRVALVISPTPPPRKSSSAYACRTCVRVTHVRVFCPGSHRDGTPVRPRCGPMRVPAYSEVDHRAFVAARGAA
jgi:hypothetical protein